MRKDELKKNNFYMTYDNYNDRVKSSKQMIKDNGNEEISFNWKLGINQIHNNGNQAVVFRKNKKSIK